MTRLPRITAKQAEKVILKIGFELHRQSGSHRIFFNGHSGKRITLPYHGHTVLHPKITRDVIRDSGLDSKEFLDLL